MHNLKKIIQKNKNELAQFLPSDINHQSKSPNQRVWKKYSESCPPGTFMMMHNLLTSEISQTFNVSQSGFDINHVTDIIQSTHENHTPFLLHNITCLQLTIYKYHNGDNRLMQIYSTSLRSLKNNNNKYKYFKLTSLPISHDSYNNPIEYITWYTPIEDYHGQPFIVKLSPISPDSKVDRIISTYKALLSESFDYLNFTKRQKQIIHLINNGLVKKEISEQLNIAVRTVEKYHEQILNRGKLLFGLNTFRSSEDVVSHLSRMNILNKKFLNSS